MKYEVFSHSKYRDGIAPGDDAILCIPGVLAAVFDGATDPRGGQNAGISPGRFAATTVAHACAKLFLDPENLLLPGEAIVDYLSEALRSRVDQLGVLGKPSTTMALALFLPDAMRLLTIGDSGVRINKSKVYVFHKLIDDVSTATRLMVFDILKLRILDHDELEYACRKVIFLGLREAQSNSLLTKPEVIEIIRKVQIAFEHIITKDGIADFLEKGIISQNRFANRTNHPLGYSALNGVKPSMEDVIDVTLPNAEITSIELFSDGYSNLPSGHSVSDWEAAHSSAEVEDFHSTGAFKTVKGATSTEFFDDRSIISIQM